MMIKICPTCGKERYMSERETECIDCCKKKNYDFYVREIDDGDEDEIQSDDEIVCPYCGSFFPDYDGTYSESNCDEIECDECGKTFEVTADITITYTTKRKEEVT
jgi:DNA-directed RNA polymerase subunit RPC12/RpoP